MQLSYDATQQSKHLAVTSFVIILYTDCDSVATLNYGIKLSTEPIQVLTNCTELSIDNPHESGGNLCNVINMSKKKHRSCAYISNTEWSCHNRCEQFSIEYVPVSPGMLRALTKEAKRDKTNSEGVQRRSCKPTTITTSLRARVRLPVTFFMEWITKVEYIFGNMHS